MVLALFVSLFSIAGALDLYSEYTYRSKVKEIVGEDTSIISYETYLEYAKLINWDVWTSIIAMLCLAILQLCMLKHLYTLINPNKKQIKRRPASKSVPDVKVEQNADSDESESEVVSESAGTYDGNFEFRSGTISQLDGGE